MIIIIIIIINLLIIYTEIRQFLPSYVFSEHKGKRLPFRTEGKYLKKLQVFKCFAESEFVTADS